MRIVSASLVGLATIFFNLSPAKANSLPFCQGASRNLQVANGSSVEWIAFKKKIIPVVGKQPMTGALELTQGTIENAKMNLSFDIKAMDSSIALRDERIRKHIFGGKNPAFSLDAIKMASKELPTAGNTTTAVLNGQMELAGRKQPVAVPVYVTGLPNGLHFTNNPEPFKLNLRQDLKIAPQLDELMKVANVAINDHIEVRFSMQFHDTCQPKMALTYNGGIKTIIDTNCTTCHSANGARPQTDFTSYASIKKHADDIIKQVLENKMPMGEQKLSKFDKEALEGWKKLGYPEN